MGYSRDIYENAKQELEKRKVKAENDADEKRKKVIRTHPELIDLETELSNAGLEVIRSLRLNGDAEKYIKTLAERNLYLQTKKSELLSSMGLSKDYLSPDYYCKKCNDTGFIDGRFCECHLKILKEYSYKEVCKVSPLKLSSFDSFSLEYYSDETEKDTGCSPRKRMREIFEICKSYAKDFDLLSTSLYFYGNTGLGKTHLSLAIANEVIKKGFTVVYGSTQNLLSQIEREKFGKSGTIDGKTESSLLSCDLLILDDLGAEFSTSFTVSVIFNIINSRISEGLPTIISSNFDLDELEKRYTDRVTSRIIGNYACVEFVGNDVRQIKRD